MSESTAGSLPHMFAGALSGLVTSFLMHPFDMVRTRLQVDTTKQYRNGWHALRSIGQLEGYRALYQGFAPALLGSGMSWGLFMWMYDAIKLHNASLGYFGTGTMNHLISAAQAGAITSVITNPVWLCKTRLELQLRQQTGPPTNGPATAIPYRGMMGTVFRFFRSPCWFPLWWVDA